MTADVSNDNTSQLKDINFILYWLVLSHERPKILPELSTIYTTVKLINYFDWYLDKKTQSSGS